MKAGIDNIVTSIIVSGELEFGMAKAQTGALRKNLRILLGNTNVLKIDAPVDRQNGKLRARLERDRQIIGQNDMWIAAHALSLGLTLVTDNVRGFERITGLRIESWLRA